MNRPASAACVLGLVLGAGLLAQSQAAPGGKPGGPPGQAASPGGTKRQPSSNKKPVKHPAGKTPRTESGPPGQLKPPPEPAAAQAQAHRHSSRISADDLKKIRGDIEKNASAATRAKVEKLREYAKQNKLPFDVGITSVVDKDISQITGYTPPGPDDLKELPEQAAIAAEMEAQRTAASGSDPKAPPGGIVDNSGGTAPVGASYYSDATTTAVAVPWMDPTQYPLPSTCSATATKWITRDALPPMRNQQTCGSCWTFSTTGALEVSQAWVNGNFYDFSEQSILDCAKDSYGYDAGTCSGGQPPKVFDFVRFSGPATEVNVPYLNKDSTCSSTKLTPYTGLTYGPVDATSSSANKDKIKAAICAYGSVSATINATPLFQAYQNPSSYLAAYDKSGFFVEPLAARTANHAIMLVGWDEVKGAWLLRNSWGVGWGEAGYAWVKYGTNGVGDNAYWVSATPGDGGSQGYGSNLGAFYTRAPKIRNSSGEAVTLSLQYLAWTGKDGWRWLPQPGYWSSYSIPAGAVTRLGSPFLGTLRASKVYLYAQNSAGTKKWTTYQTTPLNLAPDGGYWSAAPQEFEVEITSTAMVPKTVIPTSTTTVTATQCAKWSISRIKFNASTLYAWDPTSAPDIFLNLTANGTTQASTLSSDSYTKLWDFPSTAPLYLTSGQSITLSGYDRDLLFDDDIDSITATVPTSFTSGSWKTTGAYSDMEFTGVCVQAK